MSQIFPATLNDLLADALAEMGETSLTLPYLQGLVASANSQCPGGLDELYKVAQALAPSYAAYQELREKVLPIWQEERDIVKSQVLSALKSDLGRLFHADGFPPHGGTPRDLPSVSTDQEKPSALRVCLLHAVTGRSRRFQPGSGT